VHTYLVWIIAYSALLIGLGAVLARKVRKAGDFLVAGRRLGPGLIFSTLLAANIGAGTTVGAASLGYRFGWSAWWWVGSAGIGCLILANSVAARLWTIAEANDFHTLGDYLEKRYNRSVRGLISAILTIGSLGLLAAQLIALSMVFQIIVGVPHWFGAVLGGIVMIAYFTAGGLFSSARINLIELVVLLAGFSLAVPFSVQGSGGWPQIAAKVGSHLGADRAAEFFSPVGIGLSGILYYFALLAPSFIVSPGLIQKVYGARSAGAARAGVNLNSLALLLFAALPPAIGIIAAANFPSLADPQFAMYRVITDLLPKWLTLLGLAAIFSAEVSTCDAVLFMLSTSITVDLYKSFIKPDASDRVLLRVSRLASLAAGILGVIIAIRIPSIISVLTVFYSLVSVALFVPVVVGLYWPRPDARAALAAITLSVPCTLALQIWTGGRILVFLNPFVIGMGVSLAALCLVTVFTGKRNYFDLFSA